jgi:hypothetical protein
MGKCISQEGLNLARIKALSHKNLTILSRTGFMEQMKIAGIFQFPVFSCVFNLSI